MLITPNDLLGSRRAIVCSEPLTSIAPPTHTDIQTVRYPGASQVSRDSIVRSTVAALPIFLPFETNREGYEENPDTSEIQTDLKRWHQLIKDEGYELVFGAKLPATTPAIPTSSTTPMDKLPSFHYACTRYSSSSPPRQKTYRAGRE